MASNRLAMGRGYILWVCTNPGKHRSNWMHTSGLISENGEGSFAFGDPDGEGAIELLQQFSQYRLPIREPVDQLMENMKS